MNRTIATAAKGVVIASVLAGVCLVGALATAQVQFQVGFVPPPPEFVATTEPAYYEGHAAYWYRDHWYWRDEHGAWNHYEREPPFLAERRAHFPPARRSWAHHEERRH